MGEAMAPRILALGGSTKPMAASERALRFAAAAASAAGADVRLVTGRELMIPIYDTESSVRHVDAQRIIDELREADGIIVSTPGYHGGLSGMVKNALDYAEDLRHDARPYLEGRAVGCVVVAHGWQTAVGGLNQLRQTIHSLRGWPTPLGCAINDAEGLVGTDIESSDAALMQQLAIVGQQVTQFAFAQQALR
jgi:FMN reductase